MTNRTGWRGIVRLRRKAAAKQTGESTARPVRPLVVSRLRVVRPLAVVRAHFFDLDHHVRSNLYKGIRMAHLPSQFPGERRCRQEVVVAKIPQISVFVMEPGSEGEVVKRFLKGPLRGVAWHTRFEADGEDATWVETTVVVSAVGFKRLTAPVRKRFIKRAVEAMLAAHQLDLEAQGYQPPDDSLLAW